MAFKIPKPFFHRSWLEKVISIQLNNIICSRLSKPGITGRTESKIYFMINYSYSVIFKSVLIQDLK